MHVTKYGQAGSGPVLVLLHGWGSSSKIWQPCITKLTEVAQVWCVEMPGHGESHALEWDGSVEQGMELLANTLPPSCLLIGWSLGGLLAQQYVCHYPERVQSLMLIASTPKFVANVEWPHGMPESTFLKFVKQYDASPQETLKQFMALQVLHGKSLKQIAQNLEQASLHQQVGLNYNHIRWGLDWLLEIDMREAFTSLDIPIVLYHGENDQVSFIQAAEHMALMRPQVRLCKVSNAGHVPFLSHPEQFIDQVKWMYEHLEMEVNVK